MEFKKFQYHIIIRIVLLGISLFLLSYCLLSDRNLRAVYVGVLVVLQIVEVIYYINKTNRDINTFFNSILQRDFTTHFTERGKGKTLDVLYETLNKITALFKTISAEKEIQLRFLEMLVNHVRIGIISFDADEKIHLMNPAFKHLMGNQIALSLNDLALLDGGLVATFKTIASNETLVYKTQLNQQTMQLSVYASEFKLDNVYYKLISVQNIQNELDARELEAWQKLIRVLTHEIMNSVSPITSLSATLHHLVQQPINSEVVQKLNVGLDAIKTRSEGLQNFTQAYRKLTQLPQPELKEINISDLIDRVLLLMQQEINIRSIDVKKIGNHGDVYGDEGQLEQVFINLLRNAIDAVADKTNPAISIQLKLIENHVHVLITDNGYGIPADIQEKIFIPFFTTKKEGSGIGLAITRQILHAHRGEISVSSEINKGTCFALKFNSKLNKL